jgi:hypothetical protein
LKEGAKSVAGIIGGEVATEMAQQAGESAVEGSYGAGPGATWEDTSKVIMPTALMSLIPGAGGAAAHHFKLASDAKALASPDTDPELRAKIALGAASVMQEDHPELARSFSTYAADRIRQNQPIEFGADDRYHTHLIDRIGEAQTIDQAIEAAKMAVDFAHVDLAQARADNLELAPESPLLNEGIDFPTANPWTARPAWRPRSRPKASARRKPRPPCPSSRRRFRIVRSCWRANPCQQAMRSTPRHSCTSRRSSARSRSKRSAATPREAPAAQPAQPSRAEGAQYEDFLAPKDVPQRNVKKGTPLAFQTQRGAATYAKANKLEGFTPRQVARDRYLLSKPLELAPREGENVQREDLSPVATGSDVRPDGGVLPADRAGERPGNADASGVRSAEAEAPSPADTAPVVPEFDDYRATRDDRARGIRKGEALTFKTEKGAAAYAKANPKVPRNFKPRKTEDGWILSRPHVERTEAQKTNDAKLKDRATNVQKDDDLATLIRKSGGINMAELTRDGADPKDIADSLRFAAKKEGGLSLDAIAEIMSEHGYDVHDESGAIDATKARELIQQVLDGTKVYSPQGPRDSGWSVTGRSCSSRTPPSRAVSSSGRTRPSGNAWPTCNPTRCAARSSRTSSPASATSAPGTKPRRRSTARSWTSTVEVGQRQHGPRLRRRAHRLPRAGHEGGGPGRLPRLRRRVHRAV